MTEPETERCIRCDEEVPVGPETDLRAYHTLTFHQERGAFPLCNDCFDDVEGRDLWD